jgi:hypothetical protein
VGAAGEAIDRARATMAGDGAVTTASELDDNASPTVDRARAALVMHEGKVVGSKHLEPMQPAHNEHLPGSGAGGAGGSTSATGSQSSAGGA